MDPVVVPVVAVVVVVLRCGGVVVTLVADVFLVLAVAAAAALPLLLFVFVLDVVTIDDLTWLLLVVAVVPGFDGVEFLDDGDPIMEGLGFDVETVVVELAVVEMEDVVDMVP